MAGACRHGFDVVADDDGNDEAIDAEHARHDNGNDVFHDNLQG